MTTNEINQSKINQAIKLLENGNLVDAFALRNEVIGGNVETIRMMDEFDKMFTGAYIARTK